MIGEAVGPGAARPDRPELALTRDISEYLTQVMSDTEHLLFGNPHGFRFAHRVPLQDVWVPQEVTVTSAGRIQALASPAERQALQRPDGLRVDAALNMKIFRQAVVTGRPGHGKSTLCRRLAYQQALEAKMNGRGWLPIRLAAHTVNTAGVWSSFEDLLARNPLIRHHPSLRDQLGAASVLGHLWIFIDGLDEVDEAMLPRLRSRLASTVLASPNRATITCRTADYHADRPLRRLDGVPVLELSPFDEDTLDLYVENWHDHAGRGRADWSRRHLAATRGLLDAHNELRELASSPLLAAVLCVVESRANQATVGRAALLRQAVEYLLLRPEWRHGAASPGPPAPVLEPQVLLEIAGRLAYGLLAGRVAGPTPTPPRPQTIRAALERFVAEQLGDLGIADATDPAEWEAATAAYLDRLIGASGAGLLQATSTGVYEFAHRSFQEYLAAGHVAAYLTPTDRVALAMQPAWREVFLLTASIAQLTRDGLADLFLLVHTLLRFPAFGPSTDDHSAAEVAAGVCLAAEMLAELGPAAARHFGWETAVTGRPAPHPDDPTFSGLWPLAVDTTFALAQDQTLPTPIRRRAICVVSRLRDPRFVDADGNLCGGLGALVSIPGGRGQVGTDRPLLMHEAKQVPSSPTGKVTVAPFALGRRPVTNLEYGQFIADGGYDDPRWWHGEEASRWRAREPEFIAELIELWDSQKDLNFAKEFSEREFAAFARDASVRIARRTMVRDLPLYWRDARFNLPTAPVVGVNLWEASAYCAWLQDRWLRAGVFQPGDVVSLPTEIEWEWAASQGWTGQRRAFPWGDRFDDTQCLVRDFQDRTDPRIVHFGALPVGFHQLGADTDTTVVEDLAGNVWEWVTSRSLPWDSRADREAPGGLDKRGVRGGSWFSREPLATHACFRLDDPPCNAYWDLGFRLAVRREADRQQVAANQRGRSGAKRRRER